MGGPVLYCNPDASLRNHWRMWQEWSEPFLQGTRPDFFDFHAYNYSAQPAQLEGSFALVHSYTTAGGGKRPVPVAVTETDYCLANIEEWSDYNATLRYRGRPNAQAALRAARWPGHVVARQLFDLGAVGKSCQYGVTSASHPELETSVTVGLPTATEDTQSLLAEGLGQPATLGLYARGNGTSTDRVYVRVNATVPLTSIATATGVIVQG